MRQAHTGHLSIDLLYFFSLCEEISYQLYTKTPKGKPFKKHIPHSPFRKKDAQR
jgi:hypothetical protein